MNTDKPSSFSSRQLLNLGLYELFEDDPKEALAKLHKSLAPTGDEERVFAHIDGVESEKIVRSPHSVQGNPETILEVKRIMHEHAKETPPLNERNVSNVSK